MKRQLAFWGIVTILAVCLAPLSAAQTFRVATFNLENYLDNPVGNRPAKSNLAKAKVREAIRRINAEVIALQEVGTTNALLELQASLAAEGLSYPYWEHVSGFDTNIHNALLSRFPIRERRHHTNEHFVLLGRRFQTSRGFLDVEIQVAPHYRISLIAAHLKSKRPIPEGDEADMREQEAVILRSIIDRHLRKRPELNLIVLGDLNDFPRSHALRTIVGRGKNRLRDTRPAEWDTLAARTAPGKRTVTWTHFYADQDTYSRIDYILLAPGIIPEWRPLESFVLAMPDWGLASDHRPVVASFAIPAAP